MNCCIFLKGSKEDFVLTKDTSAGEEWIACTENTQKRDLKLQGQSEFYEQLEQTGIMGCRWDRLNN